MLIETTRSLGKTPSSRNPRMNANFGVAFSSLPIHFGGSDCVPAPELMEHREQQQREDQIVDRA